MGAGVINNTDTFPHSEIYCQKQIKIAAVSNGYFSHITNNKQLVTKNKKKFQKIKFSYKKGLFFFSIRIIIVP